MKCYICGGEHDCKKPFESRLFKKAKDVVSKEDKRALTYCDHCNEPICTDCGVYPICDGFLRCPKHGTVPHYKFFKNGEILRASDGLWIKSEDHIIVVNEKDKIIEELKEKAWKYDELYK